VLEFASTHFAARVVEVLGTEACLYACTPTEDFVLTVHADDARIVVGAGFSGHGFKFAPLTGRILAELALDGRSSVPEFEAERATFGWSRG
jgi:sarcosine oxidase